MENQNDNNINCSNTNINEDNKKYGDEVKHKDLNQIKTEEKKKEKIGHANRLEEEKDEVKESIK